jgi:AraC-like DNA-binding protein
MNEGTKLTRAGAFSKLKTLDDCVEYYLSRPEFVYSGRDPNRSEGHHDPLVDMCKEERNLAKVIKMAIEGRRRDGKIFSEGSCIRWSSKEKFTTTLLSHKASVAKAKTFEEVYTVVKYSAPWGIGPTTWYNVTNRIAAHLGFGPKDYLYVHAGPLVAWRKLTGHTPKEYRVPVSDLPPAFKRLPIYKLEDLLCEFREHLHPGMLS